MLSRTNPRRTIVKTSAKGRLYLDWEPMPRVPDDYLDCVVYLYPSIPAAEQGEKLGGTGFVVGVRGEQDKSNQFLYVVTNRHIVEQGNSTVRINTKDGRHDSIEYDDRNWIFAPNKFDLAIYPIPELDENRFKLIVVEDGQMLSEREAAEIDLGIGDEVFFMGRFGNVEGRSQNRPTLRFGTVAQLPRDPIDDQQTNILIEARSIPGFSGSPVFIYIPKRDEYRVAHLKMKYNMAHTAWGPKLLGIDWGHICDTLDAEDENGRKLDFKVRSNSGLMAIVPVEVLRWLLNSDKVKNMRRQREQAIKSSRVSGRDGLRPSGGRPANDANPNHREDFMRLVGAAAQKPPQED